MQPSVEPVPPGGRLSPVRMAMIGALLAAVALYTALPLSDAVRPVWYDAVAVSSLVLGFLGLRRQRPTRRRGWVLVLGGYSGWVLGDLVWTVEQHVLPDTYPAPSDAVYLLSYVALGAGVLVFVRTRRGGRDVAAVLDAAIITAGAGVLVAVFLIAPLAGDSSLSPAGKVVSSAYPLGDLFLLGVIARMYAAPGARTSCYRLLTASLLFSLGADVAWNLTAMVSGTSGSGVWNDAAWLLSYVLVAAAATVPSMSTLAEPAPDRAEVAPTRRRLAALSGGLILPAVTLFLDGATGGGVHWPVIAAGMLALSVLVFVRMVGLLNTVQVQAVRLAAIASSDALTGAPNRRTWDHELSRACMLSRESGATLHVSILDLDHFKTYNDTRGHQAGDRLLREAVAAWTDALPAGAMLARYGGEEFAVLLPGMTASQAVQAMANLRAVTPDGQTFSAGVAAWDPATDPGTAIAAADEALYIAKRTGRDRIVQHGQDPAPSVRAAAPRLTMVTQPIVDITRSAVSGHEALARFSDLGDTDVQAVFRQAHADGHGDLLELAALRAALALPDRPDGQDLYVNVSAHALASERFLAGLPARLDGIVLELGEDAGGVDPGLVAAAVDVVRARGARIALDDVGAGSQEFARLSQLRPDVVKIDRSLVAGCADDIGRTAVLDALVTYAHRLGVSVCAEGVEDVADLRHLARLGVTHVQGFLMGRPAKAWQQPAATLEPLPRPRAG